MPIPPRRSYLRLLGTAIGGGLAGCLGGRSERSPPTSTRDAGHATPTSPRTSGDSTPTRSNDGEARPEPVHCRGEPVATERSVTDEPGYDDGIEYFPSNSTVRFVSHVSGGEPARFDTWSFEEWGRIRSADVGRRAVHLAANERLGTTAGLGSGTGRPPSIASARRPVIWLYLRTRLDREGEAISEPDTSLSELATVAPKSAEVTISLDGDAYDRTVPVFADARTIRPE